MPLVRMRIAVSGARNEQDWPAVGETMEVGPEEASELQRAGIADVVPGDAGQQSGPTVHEATGRPVADLDEAEAQHGEGVDERPVETAVANGGGDDRGETAATETGTSAQRKAARAGRGRPEPEPPPAPVAPTPGPRGIQPGER